MQDELFAPLIGAAAAEHDIEPAVARAVCRAESLMRTWAPRFELKANKYFVTTRDWSRRVGITEDTERVCQKMSWGLMQVMGFRARELGFKGLLPELCDPNVGLRYGCLALKDCQRRFGKAGTLGFDENVIAAYNAGSPRDLDHDGHLDNEDYVRKVLAGMEPWEKVWAQNRLAIVKMHLGAVA